MAFNKIWKYGNDINTDMLFPGKYTYTCSTAEEIKPHLLEDLDLEFANNVQPGDIIFAGTPEKLAKHKSSYTGRYLRDELGI